MKSSDLILVLAFVSASTLSSGCASIVNGRNAEVAFSSNPKGARVIVHDHKGRSVASVNTPGVVSLKRNRRYFMPARYTATFVAPGYEPAQVPLNSTINPWILGNVVVGGIPGLIVDNATGAAWKPRCAEVHQNLELSAMPLQPTVSAEVPASELGVNEVPSIARTAADETN